MQLFIVATEFRVASHRRITEIVLRLNGERQNEFLFHFRISDYSIADKFRIGFNFYRRTTRLEIAKENENFVSSSQQYQCYFPCSFFLRVT